jgi:hypothetical protein
MNSSVGVQGILIGEHLVAPRKFTAETLPLRHPVTFLGINSLWLDPCFCPFRSLVLWRVKNLTFGLDYPGEPVYGRVELVDGGPLYPQIWDDSL